MGPGGTAIGPQFHVWRVGMHIDLIHEYFEGGVPYSCWQQDVSDFVYRRQVHQLMVNLTPKILGRLPLMYTTPYRESFYPIDLDPEGKFKVTVDGK